MQQLSQSPNHRVQTEEDCDHRPVCNAWHCFVLHSLTLSESERSWGSAARQCVCVCDERDRRFTSFTSMPIGWRILTFIHVQTALCKIHLISIVEVTLNFKKYTAYSSNMMQWRMLFFQTSWLVITACYGYISNQQYDSKCVRNYSIKSNKLILSTLFSKHNISSCCLFLLDQQKLRKLSEWFNGSLIISVVEWMVEWMTHL